jgi:hypothetical protein
VRISPWERFKELFFWRLLCETFQLKDLSEFFQRRRIKELLLRERFRETSLGRCCVYPFFGEDVLRRFSGNNSKNGFFGGCLAKSFF